MLDKFEDLGVDALVGTEIMHLTGVTPDELQNAAIFQRVKDIMDYVKRLPNRSGFINRVLVGKNVDNKLEHLWGYVELQKRRDSKINELKQLEEEIGFYEK